MTSFSTFYSAQRQALQHLDRLLAAAGVEAVAVRQLLVEAITAASPEVLGAVAVELEQLAAAVSRRGAAHE